jgi:hypothetical protein
MKLSEFSSKISWMAFYAEQAKFSQGASFKICMGQAIANTSERLAENIMLDQFFFACVSRARPAEEIRRLRKAYLLLFKALYGVPYL